MEDSGSRFLKTSDEIVARRTASQASPLLRCGGRLHSWHINIPPDS
jgi:hypothetical protein